VLRAILANPKIPLTKKRSYYMLLTRNELNFDIDEADLPVLHQDVLPQIWNVETIDPERPRLASYCTLPGLLYHYGIVAVRIWSLSRRLHSRLMVWCLEDWAFKAAFRT
jgi:hypothetical protein